MRRIGWLIFVSVVGLTGCRSTCGDCDGGLFHRMVNRDRCEAPGQVAAARNGDCCDTLASARQSAAPNGWVVSGPSYPAGDPIPLQGYGRPENELPLPRIAPPGVPEAQPNSASPGIGLLPAPTSTKAIADAKTAK